MIELEGATTPIIEATSSDTIEVVAGGVVEASVATLVRVPSDTRTTVHAPSDWYDAVGEDPAVVGSFVDVDPNGVAVVICDLPTDGDGGRAAVRLPNPFEGASPWIGKQLTVKGETFEVYGPSVFYETDQKPAVIGSLHPKILDAAPWDLSGANAATVEFSLRGESLSAILDRDYAGDPYALLDHLVEQLPGVEWVGPYFEDEVFVHALALVSTEPGDTVTADQTFTVVDAGTGDPLGLVGTTETPARATRVGWNSSPEGAGSTTTHAWPDFHPADDVTPHSATTFVVEGTSIGMQVVQNYQRNEYTDFATPPIGGPLDNAKNNYEAFAEANEALKSLRDDLEALEVSGGLPAGSIASPTIPGVVTNAARFLFLNFDAPGEIELQDGNPYPLKIYNIGSAQVEVKADGNLVCAVDPAQIWSAENVGTDVWVAWLEDPISGGGALPEGTEGQILGIVGGDPEFADPEDLNVQPHSGRLSEIATLNTNTTVPFQVAGAWTAGSMATLGAALSLSTKADLVGGLVPSAQLPSYVDDVLEYTNLAAFPGTGEAGKIYVALDTNLTYRWSVSVYAVLDPSLALGETSATAYRGDRGKTAYDHSQATGNPHATAVTDLANIATARFVGRVTAGTGAPELLTASQLRSALSITSVATDTIFDAKGDLAVGTGADTAAKLTAGASGNAPMVDASASTGLAYGAVNNLGLVRPYVSGKYYAANRGVAGTTTITADFIRFVPYIPHARATFDRLIIYTTATSSGAARVGIYDSDGTSSMPGTLILDAGAVATTAASGERSITISQSLAPGHLYWLAVNVNVSTVMAHTQRGAYSEPAWGDEAAVSGPNWSATQALTYGAMPSTATPSAGALAAPTVWLRAA